MKKEKVFIVISRALVPHKVSKEWQVSERVEFVSNLREKHYSTSVAIGDYINQKMVTGARAGFDEYRKFETYVRSKYEKQMNELDSAYGNSINSPVAENNTPLITDEFGNVRTATIFDRS